MKNLAEIQKGWNEAGITASKTSTFRHIQEMGCRIPRVKPLLNHKKKDWTVGQWSKVLFSNESKVCLSLGIKVQGFGEIQNPRCLKSNVEYPQSVMICYAVSNAGVDKLCFLKSKVTTTVWGMEMQISSFSRTWPLVPETSKPHATVTGQPTRRT